MNLNMVHFIVTGMGFKLFEHGALLEVYEKRDRLQKLFTWLFISHWIQHRINISPFQVWELYRVYILYKLHGGSSIVYFLLDPRSCIQLQLVRVGDVLQQTESWRNSPHIMLIPIAVLL